jgi:hypothetical protein
MSVKRQWYSAVCSAMCISIIAGLAAGSWGPVSKEYVLHIPWCEDINTLNEDLQWRFDHCLFWIETKEGKTVFEGTLIPHF